MKVRSRRPDAGTRGRSIPAAVVRGTSGADGAVVLRPPRASDHEAWRRLRLDDEQRIAPYWVSEEGVSWSERHSEARWVRSLLDHRRAARSGTAVSFVIESEHQLVGEVVVTDIDPERDSGEVGIWLDSRLQGSGVAGTALELLVGYAGEHLGLRHLVAPVARDNAAASHLFESGGFVCEAVMASFLDVGGRGRRDHERWTRPLEDPATGPAPQPPTPHTVSEVRWPRVVSHSPRTAYIAARKAAGVVRDRTLRRPAPPAAGVGNAGAGLEGLDHHRGSAQLVLRTGSPVDDVRDVVRAGFADPSLHRLWSLCSPTDEDRRAALRGAGLVVEGRITVAPAGAVSVPADAPYELWATTRG